MNEITTRILKILLTVFAVVLASTIFYHLLFQDYETENAVYYEVSEGTSFRGVYVRNESVITYDGKGAVRYCVNDGAKLGVGSIIAEVYEDEEQIDLRRRISERENELAVLRQVENPGTSENAQPVNLAALINEQFRNVIRSREQGDLSAMENSKQELTVLMSTYAKITDPKVDFSDRIHALEEEIARLSERLTDPIRTIPAEKSAYFVSYADGYEDTLTVDSIGQLTADDLSAVTDDSTDISKDEHAIGKLIDGYQWYITGIFDNTKLRLSEDDTAIVRLNSVARDLRVRVVSLVAAGDISKTQGVFRCDQLTQDVVQHRTERVQIMKETSAGKKTIEGVRVPRSAIRFKEVEETVKKEDGTTYTDTVNAMGVYVLIGEKPEFRRLDIVYEDEGFYLSALHAGSGYVSLYDEIIVKGVMADGE